MLLELKVSNFAIIENVHLTFKKGLNIISGETGSGKSVLLKSLSLLMGSKSSADIIRGGSEQAVVEGSFDISERDDIKQLAPWVLRHRLRLKPEAEIEGISAETVIQDIIEGVEAPKE